jgi:hypothetical protein
VRGDDGVPQVVTIGAVGEASERDDEYVNVDFSLFAELDDGRRIETGTVYSEGGPTIGWGVVDGRRADLPISRSSIEDMLEQVIGAGAPHTELWEGLRRRLQAVDISVSVAELSSAPLHIEMGPTLAAIADL